MSELLLVGIGPGHPDQITLEAVEALQRVDVFFFFDKAPERDGVDDLAAVRDAVCARHRPDGWFRTVRLRDPERDRSPADYQGAVDSWHARRAEALAGALRTELADDGVGAFLVWGEPALYDSTLRVATDALERLKVGDGRGAADEGHEITVSVIPGISSIQLLAARHLVPLNRIGRPVQVTTGRRVAAGDVPADTDLVVVLDGVTAFRTLRPEDHVYWGAYLGTPDEILVSGPLGEVADRIVEVRAEARARLGWIMDVYLVRRGA